MKQKIKAALQQGHKNLGLNEEVYDKVAEAILPFIKDEAEIEGFVNSDATKGLLTSYQSAADKVRTELNAKIKGLEGEKAELEAKLKNGNQPEPTPQPEPKPTDQQPQDMAKIIADAVASAIKPISDELAVFKASEASKSVLTSAEATFKSNDYVKKYGDEATDAWDRAMEMYEATGKKWTAEELGEKAMGYFNTLVKRKGVDTTKPFEGDGGGEDHTAKFEAMAKRQQERQGAVAE